MTKEKLLSIIIPTYNCAIYTNELLNRLAPQINDEVQVIVIDDGSINEYKTDYEWVTLIRQKNGGASVARNTGLDNAIGKYIAFIDGDDLVSEKYVETILNKIKEEDFDYCYLSWQSFGGWNCDVKLKSIEDNFPGFNLCCWNRIYRKDMIGNIRFNHKKLIAEDAQFIKDVNEEGRKKSFISDYMYYYRSNTPNSLTKKFNQGELSTERIVYHYRHITKDMNWLIDEVKAKNKNSEVIIMTENNELPELEKYAMILKPSPIKGTEFKGEYTNLFTKINIPIKTQICFWTGNVYALGGLETFAYYWCSIMKEYYDIVVLVNSIDKEQLKRLEKIVKVVKVRDNTKITCDTLLCSRMLEDPPKNIEYKRKYQMIHCCKLLPQMKDISAKKDNDLIIPVTNTVLNTYPEIDNHPYKIINNLINISQPKKVLRLITLSRLTFEKGSDRLLKLAKMLNKMNIPFIWTIFSNDKLKEEVPGVVYMNPTINATDYIAGNDYLVQLSDSEAYGYSIFEALSFGVPCIVTDLPVLNELGFNDGKDGYKLPFNMDIDEELINKIYTEIPKVNYSNNNEEIIKQWCEILGNTTPLKDYVYEERDENIVTIRAIAKYKDAQRGNTLVLPGEMYEVTRERAEQIKKYGKCEII